MTARQKEIVGIQYLRGIAATAVVADHATGMASFPKYFGSEAFAGAFLIGARGVDLFFMISGFIIAIVSLSPTSTAPRVSQYEFARRRLVRIVPLMWLAILSYMALRLIGRGSFEIWPYLRALTLWPIGELNPPHIWTLRYEAIFYCLFGVAFLSSRTVRWSTILWPTLAFLYPISGFGDHPELAYQQWIYSLAHPSAIQFSAGLGLGLVWLRYDRPEPLSVPLLWPICILWFTTILCVVPSLLGDWARVYVNLAWAAAFLPLLALAVCAKTTISRLGLLLGDASFSIYLFHPHVISALLGIWSAFAPRTPVSLVVISASLVAVGFGLVIHLTIERWLLTKFKNFGNRSQGDATTARALESEA